MRGNDDGARVAATTGELVGAGPAGTEQLTGEVTGQMATLNAATTRAFRILGAGAFLLAGMACEPVPTLAELEDRAIEALRTDVPALQETYRAVHGTYAAHIRDLTGGHDTIPSGIRVIVRGANAKGWSASSSHPDAPGAACVVFVGEPETRPLLMGGMSPRETGIIHCIAFEPWVKWGDLELSGPHPLRPVPGDAEQPPRAGSGQTGGTP